MDKVEAYFDRVKQPCNDIYNPSNSTLDEAYKNCIEELERLTYTIYEAEFDKKIWVEQETFLDFLEATKQSNVTTLFADSPKGRGWLFWNRVGPFKAWIWFTEKIDGETVTVYYELS